MLRACAPDPSFLVGGGDLSLPCLCCSSLAITTLFSPGTLGFWVFWLWDSLSWLPVVLPGGWELVETLSIFGLSLLWLGDCRDSRCVQLLLASASLAPLRFFVLVL